jgi:hypothetical protein
MDFLYVEKMGGMSMVDIVGELASTPTTQNQCWSWC